MRWLITGGCGFIGTSLIKRLLADGHQVLVFDNLSVGTREDLASVADFREIDAGDLSWHDSPGVALVVGDILDAGAIAKAATGADAIMHLAANTGVGPSVEDPGSDCHTNVIGTLNCLEAARHAGVDRFVFASSGAPVGECTPPITENIVPHPVSPYGASKLAGEGYCSAYWRTFSIATVALRFGNVYGPGSSKKSSVVAKFIRRALAGETLEIYGDGKQTRDFIFVEDLTRAIVAAAVTPDIGGEVFQIASNSETTVAELAERLIPILRAHTDKQIDVIHGERRLGDVMRNYSDTSKARDMLGWAPEIDLEEGLQRTVRYFLS